MADFQIASFDFETDPFTGEGEINPFCVGVKTKDAYWSHWGDDCAGRFVEYIKTIEEPTIFYAHNGGNFDFYYLLEYVHADILIIQNRVVKCWIGKHQIRDSYAIFPDPLSAYKKDDLTDNDYKIKFSKQNREQYKDFILGYLNRDCQYLLELVNYFHNNFGDHLTIGSCAIKELKAITPLPKDNPKINKRDFHDKFKHFYFGGRNQCFETGIITGSFTIYDINSQYASVMRNFMHPVGTDYSVGAKIVSSTCFAVIEASNFGAIPVRTKAGLDFTIEKGMFHATIHEIEAGLETGSLIIDRVLATYNFANRIKFTDFVDKFGALRDEAKSRGDKAGDLFYKRIRNSAYGKFAQDPEEYLDCVITHGENPGNPYKLQKSTDKYYIYGRPSLHKTYYNIATGASITGAARAVLLKGLKGSIRPLYCDTDSIFCHSLSGVKLHDKALGAWKNEGSFETIAIAGKKLYAAFANGECIKKAHKGSILSGQDIINICNGETVEYASKAPKFKLDGGHIYVKRSIKRTA